MFVHFHCAFYRGAIPAMLDLSVSVPLLAVVYASRESCESTETETCILVNFTSAWDHIRAVQVRPGLRSPKPKVAAAVLRPSANLSHSRCICCWMHRGSTSRRPPTRQLFSGLPLEFTCSWFAMSSRVFCPLPTIHDKSANHGP